MFCFININYLDKAVIITLFIFNLTPFIALSLKGDGGRDFREGLCPSLTCIPPSLIKGRGSGGWITK